MSQATEQKVRIVTAASLFDGHDAAINIMRRIMQSKGAEIIHLGHNRSVKEIVEAAIEEDANGIAITSYQGGHVEFFKYMKDLLEESGCGHIKIFGGGGGTILPDEIEELHNYGITRIYSPDDGRKMGLEGMIEEVIGLCRVTASPLPHSLSPAIQGPHPTSPQGGGEGVKNDYWEAPKKWEKNSVYPLGEKKDIRKIARAITLVENGISDKNFSQEDLNGYDDSKYGYNTGDVLVYSKLKAFSKEHRQKPTIAESLLWERLRNKQIIYKFRRQHIVGRFIADFICLKRGLIIEVDGLYHQLPEMIISDKDREFELNNKGFQVLRFSNEEILTDADKVVAKIIEKLKSLPDQTAGVNESLLPNSSPLGGGRVGASKADGSNSARVGAPVLGITGTGGAGKSSVTDEIVRRFLQHFTDKTIAVISVDPSKKKTGGALLGDRIRMNAISHPRAYMRSLATRDDNTALSASVQDAIDICKEAEFDFIILESAGVGQSDASILDFCDVSLYVMTPEYGAASQL